MSDIVEVYTSNVTIDTGAAPSDVVEVGYLTAGGGGVGPKGDPGEPGDSAYQLAVAGGFTGTITEWLASLVGPAGQLGPQGDQGPAGPAGEAGPQGPAGPEGPQGPQGPQGVQGATGATGLQGPQGLQGDPGQTGPQGPAGDQGPQGVQGEQGIRGEKGLTGDTGPEGPMGPQGPQGSQGIQGPKGDQGLPGNDGATGPKGDQGVQGIQGPKGDKGDQGLPGSDANVTAHEAATDPHPTYLTQSEADALYAPTGLPAARILTYSISGEVTTGVGTFRLYNDTTAAWTIQGVRATAGTAPTGAAITIDVNKNGVTIFGNQASRPSIAAGANTSGKATGMTVTSVAVGDYLTVDVDAVGSSVKGASLVIQVVVA